MRKLNKGCRRYDCTSVTKLTLLTGAVSIDITPPIGIHLHNWAYSPHSTATGIHQPLKAQILAVGNNETGFIQLLVSVDFGWWMSAADEWTFRNSILQATELPEAQLILALTHTHSGPSISREDRDRPGGHLIEPYLESVQQKIGTAAREVMTKMVPSFIDWGYGLCSLAMNRDMYRIAEKRFVLAANDDVAADSTLLIGRITSQEEERPIAVIANYAAHPTSLGGLNSKISPDFIGSARELVEKENGGVFIYLQGASGDLSPCQQYAENTAIAEKNGLILGHAVLSTLFGMLDPGKNLSYDVTVESGAPLGTFVSQLKPQVSLQVSEIRKLSLRTQKNEPPPTTNPVIMADRILRASRIIGNVGSETTEFPVTFWKMGEAVFIAYPGEAYSLLQESLREAFPKKSILFINLANGAHCGYIAPQIAYETSRYPAWQSPLHAGSLEQLIKFCKDYIFND